MVSFSTVDPDPDSAGFEEELLQDEVIAATLRSPPSRKNLLTFFMSYPFRPISRSYTRFGLRLNLIPLANSNLTISTM